MGITSLSFIFISSVSVFLYYLLNGKYRVLFLTLVSCAFIATYSLNLLYYVVIYAVIHFFIGLRIPNTKFKKLLFIIGIVINISQLILLKYVSFTVSPIFEALNIELNLYLISKIIIPVGVSYFTLQGIGYLINVFQGWEKPEKNFIHFLLYIIFYPRFLSGPIDRSNLFLPQLKSVKSFKENGVTEGFRLVLLGLFKKVVIANQLAPVIAGAYATINYSDKLTPLIIVLLQPIYLYFDFSGYTDIARGFAKAYGIELGPNFNSPFLAENMTNFWKRFHISLSSWFHDYVFMRIIYKYRKWGKNASILAVFTTWLLFGIWHGAGWTFMILGILQGTVIYYEFSSKSWRARIFSNFPRYVSKLTGRTFTYLYFGTSLVFFFANDLNTVNTFFSKLLHVNSIFPPGIRVEIFIMVMLFVFLYLVYEIIKNDFPQSYVRLSTVWLRIGSNIIVRWSVYFILLTIILVFNSEVQEFIYFQF